MKSCQLLCEKSANFLLFKASMRNTLPVREAEKALTLGTMFSTDEALKIGLIDEAATDKADTIKPCENFLMQFAKVSPDARALTKKSLRGKHISDLENLVLDMRQTAAVDIKVSFSSI